MSTKIGRVTQVIGPVVDVEFDEGYLPAIYNAVRITDFTPRFDLYKDGGTVVNDYAQGHIEVAGPVKGALRLGDAHFDIDGLVYRDHSWGKRIRGTMLSHRWIAGTIGKELTFNATSWHGTDGTLLTYGIVCRNGEVTYAKSVDIVVHMEIDAYSHRGGMLRMVLEDGDVIEIGSGRYWVIVGVMSQASTTFGSEIWARDRAVQDTFGRNNPYSYTTYSVRTNKGLASAAMSWATVAASLAPLHSSSILGA